MAALCGGGQSAPVLFQGQSLARRITMIYSHLGPAMHKRSAWNAGKTVGMKRPLTQKQIWANRFFLDREEQLRDRALFDLAFDSMLRGCDLVSSRSVTLWRGLILGAALSSSSQRQGDRCSSPLTLAAVLPPGSSAVAPQLIGTATGLRQKDHGTHSMRRTKAVMIYRITGKLRVVQILLGHTKIEDTVRYLGVDGPAECTEVGPSRRLSGVARWPLFVGQKHPIRSQQGFVMGLTAKA